MKRYIYLIERIKDGQDWKKGDRIWAEHPCQGWRIINKVRI